ncbi:outer membrane protein assembly factor BamB family protein [Mesoaciditoga sp.]
MDTNLNSSGSMKKTILITAPAVIFFVLILSGCSLIFQSPESPLSPSPSNGATNVSIDIYLRWKGQNGVKYHLYFGNSSNLPLVATNLTASEYVPSTPLNFSKTYYWKVKAKNISGEKTSPLWHFTTQNAPILTTPSSLKKEWIGSNAVSISFKDNSNNENGFVLERSEDDVSFSAIATLDQNITSYIDVYVSANKDYFYRVYAFNDFGSSGFSNEIHVKTLSASAGNLKWKFKSDGKVRSNPALDSSETAYFLSQDGNLYAVRKNGVLKWKRNIGLASSSPSLSNDTVYIGNDQGTLYAFNLDGNLKWKNFFSSALSCVSIGENGTLYVRAGTFLYAVDNDDGTVMWKYEIGSAFSGPSIGKSGTIYIGGGDWYLYAINHNGTLKWKYKTGVIFSMPLASHPSVDEEENIYIEGADWHLYSVKENGTLKWKYKSSSLKNFASPSLDASHNVYMLKSDGSLAVVKSDGTLNWLYTSNELLTSPTIGKNGEIYMGGANGLYVIKKGALKWKYLTDNVYSNPVLKDGIVYFGSDDGYLYAIHASSVEMMDSPWPIFNHDMYRSGRER